MEDTYTLEAGQGVSVFATGEADSVTFNLSNLSDNERGHFIALLSKVIVQVTAINLPD